MSFLFPISTVSTLSKLHQSRPLIGDAEMRELEVLCAFFTYEIRKYLGFGFFASFIPGTSAFKARSILAEKIKSELPAARVELENSFHNISDISHEGSVHLFDKLAAKTSIRGPILDFLTLGPLWRTLNETIDLRGVVKNNKNSMGRLATLFPVVIDILFMDQARRVSLRPRALSNLLKNLLNPVRLLEELLFFVEKVLYRLLEIGANKGDYTSSLRAIPKFIVFLAFLPARVGVGLVSMITDIPYKILENCIYNPIKFIISAVKQALEPVALVVMDDEAGRLADVAHKELVKENNQVINKEHAFLMGTHAKATSAVKNLRKGDFKNMRNLIFEFAFDKGKKEDQCADEPAPLVLDKGIPLTDNLTLFTANKQTVQYISAFTNLAATDISEEDKINQAKAIFKR